MSNISVKQASTGKHVLVKAPYHPDFPKAAKNLGGKWQSGNKTWVFDIRDTDAVRQLCMDIYGTDGNETGETVTLRVKLLNEISEHTGPIFIAGRKIASAFGRDSGARLGEGIVVISGDGFKSGGSMKNWYTFGLEGTIFEIRDVPIPAANAEIEANSTDMEIEIITAEAADIEALQAERARLMERIAEIDELLAK